MMLNREINRVLIGVLVAFSLIVLSSSYWTIAGPNTIYQRDDNPRLVEAERAIQRGNIVDRDDNFLAISEQDRSVKRLYPHSEASSMVGYSSLRYGVGGAEAAYNSLLRGDTLPSDLTTSLINDLLHRPQAGSHIKLTLNLHVQQTLAAALADQRGAAVVLEVPSGGILGLVSVPGYDPNTLDSDWEILVAAPEKPFFNRALQGNYQPGGLLETPLMAAAIVANQPLSAFTENATQPVRIGDVDLVCAASPSSDLTLTQAYAFACPYPFTELAATLGIEQITETFDLFHLAQPPTLPGFIPEPDSSDNQTLSGINIAPEDLRDAALGQGALTVTPLQMAVMAAAVINDGNAPRPFTLLSTRAPDAAEWTKDTITRPTIAYMTQQTARQIQDLMREGVANYGSAVNAARSGIDIGGHATLAFSGEETQAWFIGFATLDGGRSIAVAIVLENSLDPGLAADLGGDILEITHEALRLS